jgi:acyl-CoA synthetase (AMP-forming)/AMP-acid ligase II
MDSAGLEAFLESRIARYKIPKEWFSIDELPRTEYGKVRRTELVQRYTRRKT